MEEAIDEDGRQSVGGIAVIKGDDLRRVPLWWGRLAGYWSLLVVVALGDESP